jgi:tetraacyldisaccharide 4'-kinase
MTVPPGPLRWLLAPPGLLYRGAVALRNVLYDRGVLRSVHAGVPVISVGNLTLGGSGKTPFVAYLAARMHAEGRRIAIASRGYGGRRHDAPIVVSEGAGALATAEEAGDEPVLLSELARGAAVIVCRDRAAAALFARDRLGSQIILLDDGFQHRRLHRDADLLLIDAFEGIGNGRMLPLGPLREPAGEMRRAHAIVVTGAAEDLPAGADRIRGVMRRLGLETPLFTCERVVAGFLRAETEEPVDAGALKGMRVLAFSGIARPRSFEADLRASGLSLAGALRFRDHQRFAPAHLERIRAAAREAGADLIVTTEKDRMRLGTARLGPPLYTLRIRLAPTREEELWRFLSDRISSSPAGAGSPVS